MPAACAAIYRPRQPRSSPLWRLVEHHYEEVKGVWEERFEHLYGFWRGFVDDVVYAFTDCGDASRGFARVYCDACRSEYLLPFSCSRRGFCPSCAAKRAAIFGAFLREEIIEQVGHAMWTFTVPKLLRRYFLHDRRLIAGLCDAAWETVYELMAEAVSEVHGFRPGMVTVVHTANDDLTWNPHVHSFASRGGWDRSGCWIPVPYVDTMAAERIFRAKVIAFLSRQRLLSEERVALLDSWRRSGFSVHNSVTIQPEDSEDLERLARYLLHAPLSLARLTFDQDEGTVHYLPKRNRHGPKADVELDPLDFLARLLMHVPEPRLHLIRYRGHYSSVARSKRGKSAADGTAPPLPASESDTDDLPSAAFRRRLRRQWAQLIRRVYESDPLLCQCGAQMRVISFITDPPVIRKILDCLARNKGSLGRDPPHTTDRAELTA